MFPILQGMGWKISARRVHAADQAVWLARPRMAAALAGTFSSSQSGWQGRRLAAPAADFALKRILFERVEHTPALHVHATQ
ncbi:hypothetical protein [Indioceanicola profundi]|uniref:hypothetical protein n=1 Tax=Indioceanicola profundi TaxID=2220096 RepID=UPI000E6AAE1D|nr:hypothetical protein [Indioceanicola profundi]